MLKLGYAVDSKNEIKELWKRGRVFQACLTATLERQLGYSSSLFFHETLDIRWN
jgi:hypothetical protein